MFWIFKTWLKWSDFIPVLVRFWSVCDALISDSQRKSNPKGINCKLPLFEKFSVGSSQPIFIDISCWILCLQWNQKVFLQFSWLLWNKPIPIIPQTGTCSENRWNGPYGGFFCGTEEEKTFVSGRKLRKLRKTLENCLREWRNSWRFL